MSERRDVVVEIHDGGLPNTPAASWTGARRGVTRSGAKGIGDGFGVFQLVVNDVNIITYRIHENSNGRAVLDMTFEASGTTQRIDLEEIGAAPSRSGVKTA